MMLALKVPIAALIYIVWWAVKQTPEESPSSDDDGGIKRHPPHPRRPILPDVAFALSFAVITVGAADFLLWLTS